MSCTNVETKAPVIDEHEMLSILENIQMVKQQIKHVENLVGKIKMAISLKINFEINEIKI
jgi:hypothetical protein